MNKLNDRVSLLDLDNLIKEAVGRADDLSIVPAQAMILDTLTINIAALPDSIEIIRKLVFGINKETERLQNFIIKIDTLLEVNHFYTYFNYDLKDSVNKSIFKIQNDETKFIIKYLRLFYAIRFFPESFIKNLTRENQDA